MQLECLKENLYSALNLAIRTVDSKPTLPVLSNFFIKAQDRRMNLQSTNLEESYSIWLNAQVKKEGATVVPAHPFFELVSSLHPQNLLLQLEGTQLIVKGEHVQARFITMSPDEFPKIPIFTQEKSMVLSKSSLFELIQKTAFSAATDEGRPVLTGVLFYQSKDGLTLVATDGFRLSEARARLNIQKNDFGEETKLIIPARALNEAQRSLKDVEGEEVYLNLVEGGNQLALQIGDVQLVVRLLQAEYPDYKRIIPSEFKLEVTADRTEFLQSLKTVSIFAKRDGQVTKLFFDPSEGRIILSAESAQYGSGTSTLTAKVEGIPIEMAFNAKFLLDALNSFSSAELRFLINEAVAPVLLTSPNDETYRHVVMPIRLEDK